MGSSWGDGRRLDFPTTACRASVHDVCPLPKRCQCPCHADVATEGRKESERPHLTRALAALGRLTSRTGAA